mmetsp:Transcript_3025/g.7745  ORF Transcript_3025/g.7745 Transcript_3025/m.7745 type:complete len:478 (+) Transcript_3025:34-1467(+)
MEELRSRLEEAEEKRRALEKVATLQRHRLDSLEVASAISTDGHLQSNDRLQVQMQQRLDASEAARRELESACLNLVARLERLEARLAESKPTDTPVNGSEDIQLGLEAAAKARKCFEDLTAQQQAKVDALQENLNRLLEDAKLRQAENDDLREKARVLEASLERERTERDSEAQQQRAEKERLTNQLVVLESEAGDLSMALGRSPEVGGPGPCGRDTPSAHEAEVPQRISRSSASDHTLRRQPSQVVIPALTPTSCGCGTAAHTASGGSLMANGGSVKLNAPGSGPAVSRSVRNLSPGPHASPQMGTRMLVSRQAMPQAGSDSRSIASYVASSSTGVVCRAAAPHVSVAAQAPLPGTTPPQTAPVAKMQLSPRISPRTSYRASTGGTADVIRHSSTGVLQPDMEAQFLTHGTYHVAGARQTQPRAIGTTTPSRMGRSVSAMPSQPIQAHMAGTHVRPPESHNALPYVQYQVSHPVVL